MILVKSAPAGFIAHLHDGSEPVFDLEREAELAALLKTGDSVPGASRTWKPAPPHACFGPGGERLIIRSYLGETGQWCDSVQAAVDSLRSKKLIKAAEARVKRAEQKLEYERKRLSELRREDHRVFDDDSGEELIV